MRFTKFLAVAGAVSMLASAIPFAVSAADDDAASETKIVVDANGIVTEVMTTEEEVTIPATATVGEKEVAVVGVADYAFVLCDNLNVVNVPDSLTIENTGNVAFLTSTDIVKFLDGELAASATVDDVIKYVAEKAKYKNGNYTNADLAELSVKLRNKVSAVDISAATTVEGKVALLMKNVNNMDLSDKNKENFNLWISSVKYDDLTLKGTEEAPMKTYAEGKAILGMKYVASAGFLLGDANGDGVFNIRDAAWIAIRRAQGDDLPIEKNPAADYNQDGIVNIRDAAAMAIYFAQR